MVVSKSLPTVVLCLIVAVSCIPSVTNGQEPRVAELTTELLEMGRKDQEVRERGMLAFQKLPPGSLQNVPPELVA